MQKFLMLKFLALLVLLVPTAFAEDSEPDATDVNYSKMESLLDRGKAGLGSFAVLAGTVALNKSLAKHDDKLLEKVRGASLPDRMTQSKLLHSIAPSSTQTMLHLTLKDANGAEIKYLFSTNSLADLDIKLGNLAKGKKLTIVDAHLGSKSLLALRGLNLTALIGSAYQLISPILQLKLASVTEFQKPGDYLCGPESSLEINCEERSLAKRALSADWAKYQASEERLSALEAK